MRSSPTVAASAFRKSCLACRACRRGCSTPGRPAKTPVEGRSAAELAKDTSISSRASADVGFIDFGEGLTAQSVIAGVSHSCVSLSDGTMRCFVVARPDLPPFATLVGLSDRMRNALVLRRPHRGAPPASLRPDAGAFAAPTRTPAPQAHSRRDGLDHRCRQAAPAGHVTPVRLRSILATATVVGHADAQVLQDGVCPVFTNGFDDGSVGVGGSVDLMPKEPFDGAAFTGRPSLE